MELLVANRLLLQKSPLTSAEVKSSRRGKSNQGAQAKCGRVRKCSRERYEGVLSSWDSPNGRRTIADSAKCSWGLWSCFCSFMAYYFSLVIVPIIINVINNNCIIINCHIISSFYFWATSNINTHLDFLQSYRWIFNFNAMLLSFKSLFRDRGFRLCTEEAQSLQLIFSDYYLGCFHFWWLSWEGPSRK